MTTSVVTPMTALDGDSQAHEHEPEPDEVLHNHGMQHLQAGEWEAAIGCLSQLADRHPDHDYYAGLLNQARLKARVDENLPQRRTGHNPLRSRRIWVLIVLNLTLWLAVLGRYLYTEQILPTLQHRQAIARQQQLLEEGRQLLVEGRLEEAQSRITEALVLDPENEAARVALEEVNTRLELNQTYDAAMTLIEQEDFDQALSLLENIRRLVPGFRDVQQQIERVNALSQWTTHFQEATRLFRSGDWSAAVKLLVQLRQEAPDFKSQVVNQLLVDSYVMLADAWLSYKVWGTVTEIEQVQEAIKFLTKAMAIDPSNEDVANLVELAEEYLAGLEAYFHGDWEMAGIHLSGIYPLAPDYADRRAAELLQSAYVKIGAYYYRTGQFERAVERYRQAIALGVAGHARLVPDEAKALLQEADNLARGEQYNEAVVVYGQILSMMGFDDTVSVRGEPEADEVAR